MIDELLEIMKIQRKEVLTYLVLKLMESGNLAFSDIVEAHVKHLEMLRKGNNETLMKLRSSVIDLWCGNKKDVGKKLVSLMQEAKDNGWANLTQESINNSKWNK